MSYLMRLARFLVVLVLVGAVFTHPTKPRRTAGNAKTTMRPAAGQIKLRQQPRGEERTYEMFIKNRPNFVMLDDDAYEARGSNLSTADPYWRAPTSTIKNLVRNMIPTLQKITKMVFQRHKVKEYQDFRRGESGTIYQVVLDFTDMKNREWTLRFLVRQLPGNTNPPTFALTRQELVLSSIGVPETFVGPNGEIYKRMFGGGMFRIPFNPAAPKEIDGRKRKTF